MIEWIKRWLKRHICDTFPYPPCCWNCKEEDCLDCVEIWAYLDTTEKGGGRCR